MMGVGGAEGSISRERKISAFVVGSGHPSGFSTLFVLQFVFAVYALSFRLSGLG